MDYGKNGAVFKMFGEYYALIKSFEEVKTEDDVKNIKRLLEDWVLELPQEVQLFGLCLGSAFATKCDYDLKMVKGEIPSKSYVYRNDKGHIALKCIP